MDGFDLSVHYVIRHHLFRVLGARAALEGRWAAIWVAIGAILALSLLLVVRGWGSTLVAPLVLFTAGAGAGVSLSGST